MLSRNTELNDGEVDIGGTDNIFSAALKQLNAGAASSSGHATVVPSSLSASASRAPAAHLHGSGANEGDAQQQDEDRFEV